MKTVSIFILTVFLILSIQTEISISQTCPECICGTTGPGFEEPDSLIGGRYKPARTDIWGADPDEDVFPVLIVFVQFQNETYSYSTDPGAWNSGMPPNYVDNIISEERLSSSTWWNSYNGYAISDYWHEFSIDKNYFIYNKIFNT